MELKEKAVSKKQQRFFGMVRAAQKGEGAASPEVAKVAGEISKKDAKDFAKTKHKGLPEKKEVKEEKKGRHPRDQKELDRAQAYIKKNPAFGKKKKVQEDLATDAEKHRVPRGPGGNPIRIGDKVRSMKSSHPLGQLKVKYGADKVREYYKKNKAVGEEVEVNEGGVHVVDGKKYLKLPRKIAKGVKRDTDERHELGKAKDAVTDALGITNTKRDGVRKHDGLKGQLQMQASHYEPEGEMIEGVTAIDVKKKRKEAELRRLLKHAIAVKRGQAESFEIDKSAHKKAQRQSKIRNLAKDNKNPNEKAAAERKLKGPKLAWEEFKKHI